MSTIIYRKMEESDEEVVRAMMRLFYETDPGMGDISDEKIGLTFSEFAQHPEKGNILIIEEDGQAIGYAVLVNFWSNECGGNILDIDELFVEEQWRGKGIGTDFIKYLIDTKFNECVEIELGVVSDSHPAKALYERLGFRRSTNTRLIYEFRQGN